MRLLALAVMAMLLSGCDTHVQRSKYENLQKQLAVTKRDLDDAREALENARTEAKPGRYQTFREGFRQRRFDTATGTSCILLTTDADWKDPKTKRENCECEDTQKLVETSSGEMQQTHLAVMKQIGCFAGLNLK